MNDIRQRQWKLQPQRIPATLKGRSIYKALGRNKLWKKIRMDTESAAGGKCEICEVVLGRMYCHEAWEYNEQTHVATLKRFMWICQNCNGVFHIGGGPFSWTGDLQNDPRLKIMDHMVEVNHMTVKEAIELFVRDNEIYEKRSKHEWGIEFSPIILENYPFLAELKL